MSNPLTETEIETLEILRSAVPTLAGPWVPCENGAVGCGHITEEQDEETGERRAVACQHVVCGTEDRFIREYIAECHNAFPRLAAAAIEGIRLKKELRDVLDSDNFTRQVMSDILGLGPVVKR